MSHSLLARCQRGDTHAWQELYERYATPVYRWSLAFGLDRSSAEEVIQEVFVTAHKRLNGCETEAQLPAWFFQTTRRHAANARRLVWARRMVGWGNSTPAEEGTLGTTDEPTAELSFEVRRALQALPVRFAEVLILHDLDGRTRDEIATMLAIAPGTVASRLRTARQLFEQAWEGSLGNTPAVQRLGPDGAV